MGAPWNKEENIAIVASYLEMLTMELAGRPYSKARFRRELLPRLNKRSEGSIEYKFQNISAVLLDLGMQYINGYKPAKNYQRDILPDVVLDFLVDKPEVEQQMSDDALAVPVVPSVEDFLTVIVEPPKIDKSFPLSSRDPSFAPRKGRDYLAIEAANRSLGFKGEQFVVNYEKAILLSGGHDKLADSVEHVSQTQGDGLGFDILSYDREGREKFIEAKTTKNGKYTPFFISENELQFSTRHKANYYLYRVFEFRAKPKLFVMPGSVSENLVLQPQTYKAGFSFV